MYLKRLEIQGFKSFVDRLQLTFGPGIAVIVGPNGSGKSNIADAIRWALGEQSAKSLRGNKMEDVIFAGSEKRRPVGMAEVSMTLDNSTGLLPLEFQEVTVTRRVFRSGEGEYFINKTPCRLKDVLDLFADTGLGREAMTIIGQGKVEEVLNARPEERRALLEETAGIIKYRNRKKEALRKLDETQHHLERLGVLTSEIRRQLEPLAAEAEQASHYQKLRSELDELELQVMLRQLRGIEQKIRQVREANENLRRELQEQETTGASMEAALQASRLEQRRAEEAVQECQRRLLEWSTQLERTEGQIGVAEEKRTSLSQQDTRLRAEIAELEKKQEDLQDRHFREEQQHQQLLQRVKEQTQILDEQQRELAAAEKALREHEAGLEQGKRRMFDLVSNLSACRNEIKQLNQQKRNLEAKSARLLDRRTSLLAEAEEGQKRKEEWQRVLTRQGRDVEDLLLRMEDMQRQRGEKELTMADWRRRVREGDEQLQAARSRFLVLEEMEREKEGYFHGVRAVLRAKAQGHPACVGVCGVVADVVEVPAKLETAVEVALGAAVQDVITETDDAARRAIQYLKESGTGRATFLPLSVLRPRELPGAARNVLKAPGVIGVAADLVQAAERYMPAVRFLLGGILVVEDIRTAVQLARQTGYTVKMVTLDGDVINPGGSLTGGTYRKKGTNLLGRNREIKELQLTVARTEQQIAEDREQLESLEREWRSDGELIERLQAERQQLLVELTGAEKELLRVQDTLSHLQDSIRVLDLEDEEVGREMAGLRSRCQALHQQATQMAQEEERLNREMGVDQERGRLLQGRYTAVAGAVTEAKVALARVQQEEVGIRGGLERFYLQRAEYSREVTGKREELKAIEASQRQIEANLGALRQDIARVVQEKEKYRLQMEESQITLERVREQAGDMENRVKEVLRRVTGIREQLHQKEVEQARMDADMENGTRSLKEKYGLTIQEALTQHSDATPVPGAGARIRYLQKEIAAMGPVNLGAISEYRRLKERFEFLSGQRQDLEQARETLLEVIREVDSVMQQRFAATFKAVADAFTSVFKTLFGGGYAELYLSEPENLLETGIEIVAQPPGKKLQHLSLLSGGERALTATALLFAILQTRPSPFCVLDEIEASLDEANVERFAQFLRDLAGDTQFVVISHRQGTMEVADVLYGVTMEEPGVSKLVAVQLTDMVDRVS
ncbi:hypothetical protein SY88_06760 [Clostridiales bacterium PH28_bin88]|nr:hypothetical protein SY88_06760 [Clostridiales bacterium PH28_bin88]